MHNASCQGMVWRQRVDAYVIDKIFFFQCIGIKAEHSGSVKTDKMEGRIRTEIDTTKNRFFWNLLGWRINALARPGEPAHQSALFAPIGVTLVGLKLSCRRCRPRLSRLQEVTHRWLRCPLFRRSPWPGKVKTVRIYLPIDSHPSKNRKKPKTRYAH